MMADKSSAGDKKVTNALLTAASTGFSFDDFSDARLLVPVPVSVQHEILKNTPEATSEIDLQSDEISLDDEPTPTPLPPPPQQHVTPFDNLPKEGIVKSIRDSTFISYFTKSSDEKDYLPSTTFPVVPPPPVLAPTTTPVLVPNVELVKKSSAFELPLLPQTITTTTEKPPAVSLFSNTSPTSSDDPFSNSAQPPVTLFDSTKSTKNSDFPVDPLGSLPHQLSSSLAPVPLTSSISLGKSGDTDPTTIYAPSAPPLQLAPADTSANDVLRFSAKTPQDVVGPSSTGNLPSSQDLSNKYRLGKHRPQYAQYPGLLTNVQPMASMGNFTSNSQPPPPPPVAPIAGPINVPSLSTVPSNATNYSQEYAGTGYVFGEPPPLRTSLSTPLPTAPVQYAPVTHHWFYYKEVEGKGIWKPFSFLDSVALEEAFSSGQTTLTATDGGRYDVDVMHRLRKPVYWEETPTEVRRCSWFYKGPLDNRFIPYEEDFAQQLEQEFEGAIATGIWQRRVELGGGEAIILHNPSVMVHFCQAASPDEWGNLPESQLRPRVVKRGVDKSFLIEDGESNQIDHLVFLVHGIGAICDFKFRSIVEAVDDFRSLSAQLLHTHFGTAVDKGLAGRIEFLPVCWHKSLHGDCGVDRKLKPITLHSIPKLRNFTNDTLLDILFYTSPVYCQRIVDTVGNEINRMYDLFLKRNLSFDGSVSLTGHSLGSLILFDLLTHQPVDLRTTNDDKTELKQSNLPDEASTTSQGEDASSKLVSYTIGHAGTGPSIGQPSIVYPAFDFHPTCFFAMGSPTAVFISVRGIEQLGDQFHLPTCRSFFNIFHPYDPVAYRMETLIDPTFPHTPVVIPHHKGRKRFHLEIKDAMFRMGTDLKQTMVDTFKNTWKTFYHLASFGRSDDPKLEQEIDLALKGELNKSVTDQLNEQSQSAADANITIGQLNGGRRIDYVLQEGPLESFNEYLFALSSHVCYWESEDTMLLLMREIYQTIGVFPDNHALVGQSGTTPSIENQFQSGPPPPFQPSTSYSDNLSQNSYPGAFPSYAQTTSSSSIFVPSPVPMTDIRQAPAPLPFTPSYSFATPQQPNTGSNMVGQFVPPPPQISPFVVPQQSNQPSSQQTHGATTATTTTLPGVINSSTYPFPNALNLSQPVLPPPRDPSPLMSHNLSSSSSFNQLASSSDPRPNSMPMTMTSTAPLGPPPLSGFVRKS